jgi:hypothetical protein
MKEIIKQENTLCTNNYINAEQNSDDAQKTILPRMWSTDHIENYISFTVLLNLGSILIILMKRFS